MNEKIPGFFEGTGMPEPGWWEALWPDPMSVLLKVGVEPGLNVIDLCCGDGWFTFPLSKIGGSVIAVDIDDALLAAAKVRFAECGGTSNCRFVRADAYDIAKAVVGPVDHVFLANAFHGVPDKLRLVRAVHDVLRLGGLFAIVNWYARPREETTVLAEPRGPATELRMTPEQTIAEVEPGGLKLCYRIDVSPYHYGAVFKRQISD